MANNIILKSRYLLGICIALIFIHVVHAKEALEFKDGWVREAPPTAKNLAGYGELVNTGDVNIQIDHVQSKLFERVEFHVTSFEKGMMRMKQINVIRLKPGESILFEPGGKHLMLIKPNTPIRSALKIPFVITSHSGNKFTIQATVRP